MNCGKNAGGKEKMSQLRIQCRLHCAMKNSMYIAQRIKMQDSVKTSEGAIGGIS